METQLLLEHLSKVEALANTSRIGRFLNHPFKYLILIIHRGFVYRIFKRSISIKTRIFFGGKMQILLPASSDIFITGGKSHHSEIRLARFIIRNFKGGTQFFDIGAHYGYFTLLAAKLSGPGGKVISFEASPTTFRILQNNTANFDNVEVINNVVSNEKKVLTFYEFPNQYSEYNTMDIRPFENEKWFAKNKPEKVDIHSVKLDELISSHGWSPAMIKIDVEGAEFKVLEGFINFLSSNNPIVIMEFLNIERGNEEHVRAEQLLYSLGYSAHVIQSKGDLKPILNASDYLSLQKIDSENIVFVKAQQTFN